MARTQQYIDQIQERLKDKNLEAAERKNKENQLAAQKDKLKRLEAGEDVDIDVVELA